MYICEISQLVEAAYQRIAVKLRSDGANSIGTLFKENANMRVLKELGYFTRITSMPPVGYSAFTTIWVPQQVNNIPSYTFWTNYQLENLVVFCSEPPAISQYGTNGFTKNIIKIYVPDGDIDSYKALSAWKNFKDCIYPLSEYQD